MRSVILFLARHAPPELLSIPTKVNWLWRFSVACDRSRRYPEAESYMRCVLELVPGDGVALGTLACYVGKQGRYQEALDLTTAALGAQRKCRTRLLGIQATWLAHLGRRSQAEAIWAGLPIPERDQPDDHAMYWVCRAFYLARIADDEQGLKAAMEAVKGGASATEHRTLFFRNDVSFDRYQDRPWFQGLLDS